MSPIFFRETENVSPVLAPLNENFVLFSIFLIKRTPFSSVFPSGIISESPIKASRDTSFSGLPVFREVIHISMESSDIL